MKTSEFKHIRLIQKALHAIHSVMKASDIREDWPSFKVPEIKYPDRSEEIIFIQKIATLIAAHYRLSNKTFIVNFNSNLDAAARVEISRSDQIFIEYNHTGQINMVDLWPTMAHEIAHIFLEQIGIRFSETLHNEILTDTATIYLGFGALYLSAQRKEITGFSKTHTTYSNKRLGYISPQEMGYVLAHRDFIRGEYSATAIHSETGSEGYSDGRDLFIEELSSRPYIKRFWINRFIYKLGWQHKSDMEGISFPCLICTQYIRIPALHKTLNVSCPNCKDKILCYS